MLPVDAIVIDLTRRLAANPLEPVARSPDLCSTGDKMPPQHVAARAALPPGTLASPGVIWSRYGKNRDTANPGGAW
jgi:hypothetical protein